MAELKVELVKILDIEKHHNADKLEFAIIFGYRCVVQKGTYKKGDIVLYFPVDSILPEDVESAIFGPDSKIKLDKSRVRAIKIRGEVSQGLIAPLELFRDKFNNKQWDSLKEGDDVKDILGVKKFEPPIRAKNFSTGKAAKKQKHDNFLKYTDINHLLRNLHSIKGKEVSITEKVHGSSGRFGYVSSQKWWKRFLTKMFGIKFKQDFVFGSRNVEISSKFLIKEKGTNLWADIVNQYNLRERIPENCVIYGEIIGPGIQKGYDYGLKEYKLLLYDVMFNNKYLSPAHFRRWCELYGFESVLHLWKGEFDLDKIKELGKGNSVQFPVQKVIEGVVVKAEYDEIEQGLGYRQVYKYINEDYLLNKNNTDYH